jgi:hypothetical protein
MLNFSASKAVDFLPDEDARAWVADGLSALWSRLGEPANRPRVFGPPSTPVRDFEDLFDAVCSVQAQVGQEDVEFTLVEIDDNPNIPPGYVPLGNPEGQLMHTFVRAHEFLIIVAPAAFRLPELVFGSLAREIGRMAVHIAGGHHVDPADFEGDAELAGIALGLGPWVANGAYVFENACCGGGCGIDLRSIRTGLSLPEACFGTAIDAHRKGVSRRSVTKHLASTQTAAFKRSWSYVGKTPDLRALASAEAPALKGA